MVLVDRFRLQTLQCGERFLALELDQDLVVFNGDARVRRSHQQFQLLNGVFVLSKPHPAFE